MRRRSKGGNAVRRGSFLGWALALALPSLPLAGCVGAQAETKNQISELQRQLDIARQDSARDRDAIKQLENRVYVLEDKLETVQVASDRAGDATPRLPVVTKKPDKQVADATPQAEPPDPSDDEQADDGQVEVVYEGDAAKDDGPRPKYTDLGPDVDVGTPSSSTTSSTGDDEHPRRHARGAPRRGRTTVDDVDPSTVTDTIPVTAQPAPLPKGASSDDADDPVGAYRAALASLKGKDYATAIDGFRGFLARWPKHEYADNAQYWLGEAYYAQKDYQTALVEFRKGVESYPSGNKAPDALLKLGYCYALVGDDTSARDVLAQVVEIYPKTEAAKLAAQRLAELREKNQ